MITLDAENIGSNLKNHSERGVLSQGAANRGKIRDNFFFK